MFRFRPMSHSTFHFSHLTQRLWVSSGFRAPFRIAVFALSSLLVCPVGKASANAEDRTLIL